MVESPPKLIIKVAIIVAAKGLNALLSSIHPRVISISPAKGADIKLGKSDKMGEREVMITKKIAIIVPTEITLNALSITIDESSCLL